MSDQIESIFSSFSANGEFVKSTPINTGHINATYLIETDRSDSYVLQKINSHVFAKPEFVVANKVLVAEHLRKKSHGAASAFLRFHQTTSGTFFVSDEDGHAWNLMNYIKDSHVFLKAPNAKVAYEAGYIFGDFLTQTADLDPESLVETLPRFHSMSLRYEQFRESLENANDMRLAEASEFIETALAQESEMQTLEEIKALGELPIRVTHNDTKISNALFSNKDNALCVIDLDTVMPGIVHYDFGDAIRTICSGADEDEPTLENVRFNQDYFESFVRGFLKTAGKTLTDKEIAGLATSSKVMTFIIGLRFLTDYLNNDVYFDTEYDNHNLIRARNQFRLAKLISQNLVQMNEFVARESA